MDVVKIVEKVDLYNMTVTHDIPVPGHYGKTPHVILFTNDSGESYYWVTVTSPGFKEGVTYNIRAKLDTETKRLSFVKNLDSIVVKSEQPDAKPDAEDIILGLSSY